MHPENPTVAHVVHEYLPVSGSWIYNQIRHLTSWQALVLCTRQKNLDIFPFRPIYSLDSLSEPARLSQRLLWKLLRRAPLFQRAMRDEGAEVVHAHFGPTGFHALPMAHSFKVPLVTTFYGYDLSLLPKIQPKWRSRYHRLFAEGALFLVEGPHMKQQLVGLGCPEEKVCVQRLGIDLRELPFQPRQVGEDGTVRVLVAATFAEKKGLPYALEAFGRVFQRHKNMRLTIIGDARADHPDELRVKQTLHDLVAHYQLAGHVDFRGYQPHPALIEAFYQHHILISPSVQAQSGDNEGGSPVTITEATASGMPVLSTFHCDIPEVVRNGESGFLVAERDVEGLADRLEYLVQHPEIWPQMGEVGRQHVETNFDAARQAKFLEERYSHALA